MSDIEANRAIALESVVPVVLTEDEQKQEFAAISSEINRKQEILKIVMPKLPANIAEKVAYSIDISIKNETTAASSTEIVSALNLVKESDAVLTDSLMLVKAAGIDISVAAPVIEPEQANASTTEAATTEGGATEAE
jgi:hypothetical protein